MLLRLPIILALTASAAFAISEENVSQTLDVTPGGNLVVDVNFGTVDVSSGSDNQVAIQAHRKIEASEEAREKQFFDEAPIVISKEGNTVTIRARRITEQKSWSWSGNVSMDGRYTVRVPKNFNLDLKTGGGMVSARDITGVVKISTSGGKLKLAQLRGPVDAKTSGGSIKLEDCQGNLGVKTSGGEIRADAGSGSLDARTSGGSIVVRNFKGDTTVKTSGGQLTFENIGGKVIGQTSGGSITAALISPLPGEVELSSSAGSIDLTVPSDAALNLEADASNGTVSNSLPIVATHIHKDALRGAMNGGGKSVILRSSVGSISLRPAAPKTAMQ
ncbi:MAG: DUF4097 family beta strand repeat protein [Chthoniobacterales bacterium]|nr:DUF4097 family beta strand repeat protein [Chthoniobacterales bacterium]